MMWWFWTATARTWFLWMMWVSLLNNFLIFTFNYNFLVHRAMTINFIFTVPFWSSKHNTQNDQKENYTKPNYCGHWWFVMMLWFMMMDYFCMYFVVMDYSCIFMYNLRFITISCFIFSIVKLKCHVYLWSRSLLNKHEQKEHSGYWNFHFKLFIFSDINCKFKKKQN